MILVTRNSVTCPHHSLRKYSPTFNAFVLFKRCPRILPWRPSVTLCLHSFIYFCRMFTHERREFLKFREVGG